MKRFLIGLLLFGLPGLICAQAQLSPAAAKVIAPSAQTLSLWSLDVTPGLDIPLGASSPVFGLGGSVLIELEYRLPFLPLAYFSVDWATTTTRPTAFLSQRR